MSELNEYVMHLIISRVTTKDKNKQKNSIQIQKEKKITDLEQVRQIESN